MCAIFEIFKGGDNPEEDQSFLEEMKRIGREEVEQERQQEAVAQAKIQEMEQKKHEKTAGGLSGLGFAPLGAGVGGGVMLLGELLKQMLRVDFDQHGLAVNDDATKMFAKGYDWAYGKKKAA